MYDLRYAYHTLFEHWLSVLVPMHESLLVLRAHAAGTETLVVVDGLEPPTAHQSSAYERYKLSALPIELHDQTLIEYH